MAICLGGQTAKQFAMAIPQQSYINRNVTNSDNAGGAVFYCDMYVSAPDVHHELRVSRILANGELAWAEQCVTAGYSTSSSISLFAPAITDVMIRTQWLETTDSTRRYSNVVDLANGGVPIEDRMLSRRRLTTRVIGGVKLLQRLWQLHG